MSPDKLKDLRNELGLSVNDAAVQVQIHPRSWARYESGDRVMPKGIFELFCLKNGLDYAKELKELRKK